MADYHVTHDKSTGDWGAKKSGASRAAARFDTQAQAYDAARGLAERSGGGDVFIHRKDDNVIRDRSTVGKPDPFPPEG
jgi:hypothetical protein